MELLLERLSPGQIVAVISVISGCVVGLAMIVAIAKYQLQWLTDDTALKREKQQAELALKERLVERGGSAGGPSLDSLLAPERGVADDDAERLNAELAKRLGALDAPGDEIETVLARAMAADMSRKATIIAVLDELLETTAPPRAVLAAVRPLCGPTSKAAPAACA